MEVSSSMAKSLKIQSQNRCAGVMAPKWSQCRRDLLSGSKTQDHVPSDLFIARMTTSTNSSPTMGNGMFAVMGGLFIFFWASGFVAAKYGLPYAEPFTLMTARFIVASAIMVPACPGTMEQQLWRSQYCRSQ